MKPECQCHGLISRFITFPPTMLMPNDLFSTRSSMTSRSWPHDASSVYVFFNDRSSARFVERNSQPLRKICRERVEVSESGVSRARRCKEKKGTAKALLIDAMKNVI
jgi:hypothetical protein